MRQRSALTFAVLAAVGAPLARSQPAPADIVLWHTLAAQAAWCGLALLFALLSGGSVRERLGLTRGRLSAPLLALGALGTLALSGALQFAVDVLALAPGTSLERLDSIARLAAPESPWLVLAAFGLAPGFAEELLFRGAFQRSLANRIGGWCVPAAALAFGALHVDRVHSPAAFVLGCYLGALALLGDSTWLSIACHVANNCAALQPQLLPGASPALPRPDSWVEAAVWLACSCLSLALIGRRVRRSAPPAGATSG